MARSCLQLLECAPRVDDGLLDLWRIESRLRFPAPGNGPADIADLCCLLLSFNRETNGKVSSINLTAALSGVRVRNSRFTGAGWAAALQTELLSLAADFESSVLLLGDGPDASNEAQTVLDALRSRNRDASGLVVAVTSHPERFSELRGVDGFVRAPLGAESSVARTLGIALGSMTAPTLLSCVDVDDIQTVLSASDAPATLVHALWLERQEQLYLTSDDDEDRVRRSPAVAAFIYLGAEGTFSGVAQVIRSLAESANFLAIQVPVGYLGGTGMEQVVPVVLMCAT